MEETEDDSVLNAIIIASVIGILIVAGLILFYPKPSEDFTAIYFGNYTKKPVGGIVSFNYTIENHENRGMTYDVAYLVDNATISNELVFVGDGGNTTLEKSIAVNASQINKVGVLLNTTEEIHFWTTI
ncbi:MAG: hypothetical protein ABIF85_07800 [Nanoarchaeota archaeon]